MSIRKSFVTAAFAAVTVLGTAGTAAASGAGAIGGASDSPGFMSGNNIQIPINNPINVCGFNIGFLSALLSTDDTVCVNR